LNEKKILILCEGKTEAEYLQYLNKESYYCGIELIGATLHTRDTTPKDRGKIEQLKKKIEDHVFTILDDYEGEPWNQYIKKSIKGDLLEKIILTSPNFECFLLHYFIDDVSAITKKNVEEKLVKHIPEYGKAKAFTKKELSRDNHEKMLERVKKYKNSTNQEKNYTQMHKLFDYLDAEIQQQSNKA
jgi:hypothetical protein